MLSIQISVGSGVEYSVPSLSLTGVAHQVQVNFEEGEHVFTSPDLELGTIHAMRDTPLIGRLIFRYKHGKESGFDSITVCDADFESADGMTLMTFPKGREDASCFERASSAGFAADEIHRNRYWNTRSSLIPGASQIFKNLARDASRAVIATLETKGIILNVRTPFPEIPEETYHKLCYVVQDGEVLCSYEELHQRKLKSEGKFEIFDLRSTFGGTTTFPPNSNFANVLGSSPDPKPPLATSWIQLWNSTFNTVATQCSSLGFPTQSGLPFPCTTRLVGGHVIRGSTASAVATGSNDVRIIPICNKHNHVSYTGAMQPVTEGRAVVLHNYMQ